MAQAIRLPAAVTKIDEHAPDLFSVELETRRPVPRFRPGQFLHLAVDQWNPSEHWPDSRAFSISSSPKERRRLRLTFSVVGRITKRMAALSVGDEVWLKLPYGDFVVSANSDEPSVLVAGGTGVTPFVSWLGSLDSSASLQSPTHILYGARHKDLLIYRSFVEEACSKVSNLTCRFYAERGAEAEAGVIAGPLILDDIIRVGRQLSGPEREAVYYLSGPPSMLDSFRAQLEGEGVAPDRIRLDAWS